MSWIWSPSSCSFSYGQWFGSSQFDNAIEITILEPASHSNFSRCSTSPWCYCVGRVKTIGVMTDPRKRRPQSAPFCCSSIWIWALSGKRTYMFVLPISKGSKNQARKHLHKIRVLLQQKVDLDRKEYFILWLKSQFYLAWALSNEWEKIGLTCESYEAFRLCRNGKLFESSSEL